jgi:isochorismate hydrolase
MTNLEKVKSAGVDVNQMSPEEKQVVETLSPEEMDTLLKAKGKYDQLTKGIAPSTSLKVL